jgi:hypothetical protein
LQRTRTSVDALTMEQLTEMRARISDEVEVALEQDAKVAGPEWVRRRRIRQWVQLVADAVVRAAQAQIFSRATFAGQSVNQTP